MKHKVGQFTYDTETRVLTGPAAYMKDQGNAKLESILSGKSQAFNLCAHRSPCVEVAVLVALQTDYAGWHGVQLTCAELGLRGR